MNIGFGHFPDWVGKAGCGYYTHAMIKAMLAVAPQHYYALYPSFGDYFFDARMPISNPLSRRACDLWSAPPNARDRARVLESIPTWIGLSAVRTSSTPTIFWTPVQIASSRLIYTLYDMGFASIPIGLPRPTESAVSMACFARQLRRTGWWQSRNIRARII